MSDANARELFRYGWEYLVLDVPLISTINTRVDRATLPDVWATYDFLPDTEELIGIGTKWYREEGTIMIFISGISGKGQEEVELSVKKIRDGWRNAKVGDLNDSGSLKILEASSPHPIGDAVDGRWYRVALD